LKRSPEHPAYANDPAPNRKLRIGYVSADFRRHPVAWFMESVLRTHNRGAVEIFCYSNNRKDDATTERLKPLADVWRPVGALDDREMAALVRADAIDILVDLSGHTVGGRLMVFRAKPAPIQCTWLGYYATTGLPEIDYIIADRFIIPAGDERHYSEAPWRLPDSYLCFTPPDLPVAVGQLPAQRNGFVTFGSCSNIMKVNLGVVAVWSRLLHAVANSRLILRSHALTNAGTGDELMRHFLAHDIAADRITLLPAAERAELLATYNEIDIALDPFPYGGGTTTVESLWMGVPVVTMRGDRFTGRVSESILSTAGLPELVVADEAAYLGKAITLSQNLTHLAELRAGLRDRLERSPMCNASRFTGHLEEAYRGMWRNWCAARETAA
jgi:protein O-GlcNAc transferase